MSDDSRIDEILGRWRERRDRGERIDPESVIEANPHLADTLRARFAAIDVLDATLAAPRSSRATKLRPVEADRYADFRVLGQGGMGIVYWALDTDLNRQVAFKVVRPDAGQSGEPTPTQPLLLVPPDQDTPASQAFATLKARFLQEAWVTAALEHPGIVPVYEVGRTTEGVPYYTMRFVRGSRTLAAAMEDAKGKGIEERLALLEPFLRVCDTIRYAHAHGVIHRDLKPDNVALGEFGEVVVLDWGLAKMTGRPDAFAETWQHRLQEYRDAADLKTMATALGTPGYMAPEAALGRTDEVDAKSDIYSLGAILFQILVGRLPYEFRTYGELAMKLMREDAPDAASLDASVPAALASIAASALARDRNHRTKSVDALVADVRGWLAQQAANRELDALREQAKAAFEAASGLTGDLRLHQLDRAASACDQVLAKRADDATAASIRREIDALRATGVEERARAVRGRFARRAAVAALVFLVVAGAVVAKVLDDRRQEAVDARAATAAALAAETREREAKHDALRESMLRQARAERLSVDRTASVSTLAAAARDGATSELRAAAIESLGTPGMRFLRRLPYDPTDPNKTRDRTASSFSSDGERLAAVANVGVQTDHLVVWDVSSGDRVATRVAGIQNVERGATDPGRPQPARFSPSGAVVGFVDQSPAFMIRGGQLRSVRQPDVHLIDLVRGTERRVQFARAPICFGESGRRVLVGGRSPIGNWGGQIVELGDDTMNLRARVADEWLALVGDDLVLAWRQVDAAGPHAVVVLDPVAGTSRELLRCASADERDSTTIATSERGGIAVIIRPPDSGTRRVEVWDLRSIERRAVLDAGRPVACVDPDGEFVAVHDVSEPDAMRVYDVRRALTLPSIRGLSALSGPVVGAALSRGGLFLAVESESDAAVWSVPRGERIGLLRRHVAPSFSPDARRIATHALDDCAFDVHELAVGASARATAGPVRHLAVSADGSRVAAEAEVFALERMPAGVVVRPVAGNPTAGRVSFTAQGDEWTATWPTGKGVLARLSEPVVLRGREASAPPVALAFERAAPVAGRRTFRWPMAPPFAMSPDGRSIAFAVGGVDTDDDSVYLSVREYPSGIEYADERGTDRGISEVAVWDRETCALRWKAALAPSEIRFSPDGRVTAVNTAEGIHVLDGESGAEIRLLPPGPDEFETDGVDLRPPLTYWGIRSLEFGIASFCFSSDGRRVYCGESAGYVGVLAIDGSDRRFKRTAHRGPIAAIAVRPDDALLATGGPDRMIRLLALPDLREIVSWTAHELDVTALAFSPDGRVLVSAGADGTLRVWDIAELSAESAAIGLPWEWARDGK